MTKPRKPNTHYRALHVVADHLGWDRCAAIIDLSESMLRKMGDPETGREIKLRDAMRLEAVFRQDGGEGSPFFDCFAARLTSTPSARTAPKPFPMDRSSDRPAHHPGRRRG